MRLKNWLAIIAFMMVIASTPAYAASEEPFITWLSAAGTVLGVGWFWRRTVRAADKYEVWFGTNRNERVANTFDNVFGTTIHFGKCVVTIPKGHVFGSIGSSRIKRWFMRLFSGSDDRLAVAKLEIYAQDQFAKYLQVRLAQTPDRSVTLYIHGYNVKFKEAAIRAAQIGFDLKVPGVMAFYSWPSLGRLDAYFADSDSVAASEQYLYRFITHIAKSCGAETLNIIAHSMGNLGLIRALSRATSDFTDIKIGQVLLAAPDIDIRLFRELAIVYPRISDKTTLYVSASDQALNASHWVHKNQRTGYTPPVTVIAGIDTIEATNVDVDMLGHGYYADAAGVLYDMAMLIRSNLPPEARPSLYRELTPLGEPYWVIRKHTS